MIVSATRKDLMIVNMGPHLPSIHGRDGKNSGKLNNYTISPLTRWDYLSTMFTEAIMVNGLEQLGNIQVPKRTRYIGVIMLELSYITSHLLCLGPFMADIERERELIYDLFEASTGMRM
ncbi:hypothetical protein MKW98_009221, partial [Papaver atlanticum]